MRLRYITHRISFGVILGVLSLLAEGLGQLIIVSKLLASYTPSEVGFWFLVTNFIVLIQLGQGGLTPVGVRRLAQSLPHGIGAWLSESHQLGKAYFSACLIAAISIAVIAIYIASIAKKSGIVGWALLWALFSVGILSRIYALRWVNAINSVGLVGIDKVVLIVGIVLNICGYWLVSESRLPLAYLGGVYGMVGIIYALSVYLVFRTIGISRARLPIADYAQQRSQNIYKPLTVVQYAQQSWSFLVLNISGFFVLNADVLMVGTMFGTANVTYFSVLAKLGFLVLAVSTLFQQMAFPFVAHAWGLNDLQTVKMLYLRGIILSLSAALIGSVLLLSLAPKLLPLWLGSNSYLGSAVFASQLVFVIFSVHTIAQATPVLATGSRRFTDLAVLNAILALGCSLMFAKFFGLIGIPVGNAVGTFIPSVLHGLRSYRALFSAQG